jgi:uncharacterized protein (TIGR02147 family)
MQVEKSIFEYDNFRSFLKDRYLHSKSKDKKFSFRFFARICGFKSPSFLKLVMDGKANLSRKSAHKVAAALKLNKEESEFFLNLVLFEQAPSSAEKHRYARQILSSHKYKKIHPISEAQFNYYSNWYFIPVRELISMPDFVEDPKWIAERIEPSIEPREAKKALEELQALGLLVRDLNGKLTVAASNIHTSDEVTSQSIAQYHREMMKRAMESIDRISREDREISSLTMGVSEKTAKKVKERIQEFRRELTHIVSQDDGINMVYQLNFQFFPVTKLRGEKDKK